MGRISKRKRFEVLKRDHFRCSYCGARAPGAVLEVDHIHPVTLGGCDDEWNLTTACVACNVGKGGVPIRDTHDSRRVSARILDYFPHAGGRNVSFTVASAIDSGFREDFLIGLASESDSFESFSRAVFESFPPCTLR